jgi:hypothetical protein
VRKPAALAVALSVLALLFGWKTREAWRSPPPALDEAGLAAADLWQPGAPVPDPAPSPQTAPIVAAIAARPLFRPDRAPFSEPGEVAAAGRDYEGELSRLALIGTLTFGGELKAIVVSKGGPASERWEVKAGDRLQGFTVKEVQIDGLALTADDRDFLLPLYAGAPTSPGTLRTEIPRTGPSSLPRRAVPSQATAPQRPDIVQPEIQPENVPERTLSRPPRYYPRRR